MDKFEQYINNEIEVIKKVDEIQKGEVYGLLQGVEDISKDVTYKVWEAHIRLQTLSTVLMVYQYMKRQDH